MLSSHQFSWALACGLAAIVAIVLATTALADPRGAQRRAFLRQCHDEVQDRGGADACGQLARQRFGTFDSAGRDAAYVVAAVMIFAGTALVVAYVVKQVRSEAGLGR